MPGDLCYRQLAVFEHPLGEDHTPAQEILHRRHADSTPEAIEEGGARHCCDLRQAGHVPGSGRLFVDGADRLSHLIVAQPRARCRLGSAGRTTATPR